MQQRYARTPRSIPKASATASRFCSAQRQIARAISESSTLEQVIPRVLEAIGTSFDWSFGAFWVVDGSQQLTCVETWTAPGADGGALERDTWRVKFGPG